MDDKLAPLKLTSHDLKNLVVEALTAYAKWAICQTQSNHRQSRRR